MKKTMICAAALLLAGTVLTACSGGDDVTSDVTPVSQPAAEAGDVVELSGTLGGKSSTTRAIAENGTGTWEVGDKFAVYYETANGHASTVATVNSVYSDGSANFKATLHSPKAGNNDVTLVYPASAHDGQGGFKTDGLMNQGGTLEYINQNGLDIETATPTMNVEGMTAKLKENVTMQPQVCLYKLDLKGNYNQDLFTTKLEISDGTHTYTVTPAAATNSFTIALLPIQTQYTFTATTTRDTQFFTKRDGVKLDNCTLANIGDVFDKDGNIYEASTGPGAIYSKTFNYNVLLEAGKFYTGSMKLDAESINNPGVAMIAYVGEKGSVETGRNFRGLAVAMKDAVPYMARPTWCSQYSDSDVCTNSTTNAADAPNKKDGISVTESLVTGGHTHAAASAAHRYGVAKPDDTSDWFLPSVGQWQLIFWGVLSKAQGTAYTTPITTELTSSVMMNSFNNVLYKAGADKFVETCYWLSSEYNSGYVWSIAANGYVFTHPKMGLACVRSVLAFE